MSARWKLVMQKDRSGRTRFAVAEGADDESKLVAEIEGSGPVASTAGERIVRAVNAHDALVAALRRVVEAEILPADEMPGATQREAFDALDNAKKVLASVDGKEPTRG